MQLTLPFTLPDWLPAWAFLLLAIPVLLYALLFLIMPFSTFGLKSRLDRLETQLEDIQEDLRALATRKPPRANRPLEEDPYEFPNFNRPKPARPPEPAPQPPPTFRPVAPAPVSPTIDARDKLARLPQRPPRRTEPRLD
jgi:hypothetical protein